MPAPVVALSCQWVWEGAPASSNGQKIAIVSSSTSCSTGRSLERMARPAAMYSNIFIGLQISAVFPPLEVATVRW